MQTHSDSDANGFFNRLNARAAEMVRAGKSKITAGAEGEQPLAEWDHEGIRVTHMPPDEQGILRISIGGGVIQCPFKYATFRGDRGLCISLLKQAIAALEHNE